jgi:penicillin-binding protein 1A
MVTRKDGGWEAYCRCPVVLRPSEIPEVMKKAIVAVEDKRYFDHGGVDLISLLSVLKGGLNRGGSTIPMQLLKNLVFHDLLQRDVLTRLERKGAEFWHAGSFDGAVGKDALLAAYLNQIEFGGREIVGLYRAARHYFRKEPKDLNLYEAATLAGMVQAPARFNPLKEATQERAHERAKLVLRLMVEQGKITRQEARTAERRGLRPGLLPEFKIQSQAFTEWVAQTWGPKYVQPGETVRFFVTIEPRFQQLAESHLDNLVDIGAVPSEYDVGAVMMDRRGRVQAMVGTADWTRRHFNNAVKGQVQPGSTAKLPLLVAACEAGMGPQHRVVDLPLREGWPANGSVGYRGDTTLREAFARSRNAAAVRLTRELGIEAVAEAGRRLGIEPGPKPDSTVALGTFSSNVLAMTSAYAAIANGGFRVHPAGILAVVDGRGEVRGKFLEANQTRVVPQRCIEPIRSMLHEVVRAGTGRGAALQGWRTYGKTGTTSANADAWFIGWSEGRVLGVWMGKRRDAPGEAVAGSGPPADLFRRVSTSVNALVEERRRHERSAGTMTADAGTRQGGRGAATDGEPRLPARTSNIPIPPMRPQSRRRPTSRPVSRRRSDASASRRL